MSFTDAVSNFAQSATSAVVDGLVHGIALTVYLPGIFTGITLAAAVYLSTVLLYALYLAYCTAWTFKEAGRLATMPWAVRGHIYAIVYVALILDVAFNVTVGSLVFLELPEMKRLTFTARCKKWKDWPALTNDSLNQWRRKVAHWVCNEWLNPGDPGHC